MSDGQSFVIPGPYGAGHPDYEIGFKHGEDGLPAVRRDDETYMNGWADGRISARSGEASDDIGDTE